MKTLVLGASGATGKLVVSKLVEHNITVKAVIRETASLPKELAENSKVETVRGSISAFTAEQIIELISDCDSIVSCLGHNINFKGIFGKPRNLVFDAVKRVADLAINSGRRFKFILMSTTAYTNNSIGEKNSPGELVVFSLLKLLLPPHADNMAAGDYLVYQIKSSTNIEWVAVRPDALFEEPAASRVVISDKKLRSPIFNPGKTSRINVAQFMSDLLTNDSLWQQWRFKTPVIYNQAYQE